MRKILFVLSCCIIGFSLWGCGASQVSAASDETTPTILETVVETEPVVEETFVEDVTVATEETLPPEPLYKEYEYFTSDVSYEFEYIENGEVIPHVFFEPSTAEDFEKIPLIVWLHGSGEKGRPAEVLKWSGLLKAMVAWDFVHLEGLNAYIVAPHLIQGDFWSPYWCSQDSARNIQDLIDYYVENYNVDRNQVVLSGHSLGGQGVAYLTQVMPEAFCAAAPLSVYHPTIKLTDNSIPMWCFQGNPDYGEDNTSHNYAYGDFANFYGRDAITMLNVGHGDLPMAAFSMDKDGNNRTDLFEWFAEHMQASAAKVLKDELGVGVIAEDCTS